MPRNREGFEGLEKSVYEEARRFKVEKNGEGCGGRCPHFARIKGKTILFTKVSSEEQCVKTASV